MEKKILALSFSGRKNGNTSILVNELLRPCREQGVEVNLVNAVTLDIRPCTGCFGCNNGELKCVLKDDLEALKQKIAGADAIVVAAPTYIISAPGVLKNIMDRSAAWGLDAIENRETPKIGLALSVAGATQQWFSLQRAFTSLFLKLYNCRVVFQKVYSGIALKGEVLLHPEILAEVRQAGQRLARALAGDDRAFPLAPLPTTADESLICPVCQNDVFQVGSGPRYTCAVCGHILKPAGLLKRSLAGNSYDKFAPQGAKQHSEYVGGKILNGMDASEEIRRRLRQYIEEDCVPQTPYQPLLPVAESLAVSWDPEGLVEFERVVPPAFQKFVKKAIEKKASQSGHTTITREVFLKIKKESGN